MATFRSEKPKNDLKRAVAFIRPYLPLQFGVLAIMLLMVGLGLLDPLVLKILIDDVLIDKNSALLDILIAALLCLFLLRAVLNLITNYLAYYVSQRIMFDVRFKLFRHLEKLHIDFFAKSKTGEILSRVNNDVMRIQNVLTTTLISLATDIVTLLAITVIIFSLNWKLALMSVALFPPLFVTQLYMGRKIRTKSREARDTAADIVSFFQEVFSSIRLVQAFVREHFEAVRMVRKSRKFIDVSIRVGMLGALAGTVAGLFSALGPAIVLWYGGHQVMAGAMTLGGLVAFYAYVGRLFGPVLRLAQHNVSIQSARAAMDRILEYFDVQPEIADTPGAVALHHVRGHVVFNNVSFSYEPGEPVLEKVSFQAKPGQKIAIVGESGVGKTTIVNLLCRFYDPDDGSILVDGHDVRNIRLASLRKHIGIVSQETILFNTTIRENLLYGKRDASEEEIRAAADKAHIRDFIESLPREYDTVVGERGVRLSGGQCQRLSIARTILKNPEIVVFDEAMSSLDTESEFLIQKAIAPFLREKTTIVVAHRLSSITDADEILVLRQGRIVERGRHDKLVAMGGAYTSLWNRMNRSQEGRWDVGGKDSP